MSTFKQWLSVIHPPTLNLGKQLKSTLSPMLVVQYKLKQASSDRATILRHKVVGAP